MALRILLLLLLPTTTAKPPSPNEEPQTAHLTFRSASSPETYNLTVKADGKTIKTGHAAVNVSRIDAPDYLAQSLCTFTTPGPVRLEMAVKEDGVTQQVVLVPAQAVLAVRCWGKCVHTYGACYDTHNQPVGPCCNGLCVATRCRAWNLGHPG
ncbi:hypothetical protein CDD80_3000 [Ophiocordyceps camponoti-rufipedis]|uniref:Uncharacterized protein n=1 Tax=Ophiocordyceps camponoti-rufipedis TaxID=2004952 RepID=A0A2C5Z4B5_9HYPO|nr:hypothetical protein CDD80_3000 [Ophiocordyceps camponoti-rufipedis]